MKNGLSRFFAASLTIAASACSGGGSGSGGGPPGPSLPPVITKSYTFPSGDATAVGGGTAWDIVGVQTTLSGTLGSGGGNAYNSLRVDVIFAQDISNALPAPGQPLATGNQLGVLIALDSDGNPSTGNIGPCNFPNSVVPFEYASDQGNDPNRLTDGNYSIIHNSVPIYLGGPNPPAEAATSAAGHIFSQTFFLPAISVFPGTAAPKIGLAVAAFNGASGSFTDCVPSGAAVEVFTS